MQESQQQQPTGKAKAKAEPKAKSNQPSETIEMIEDKNRSIKNRNCVYSRDPKVLGPKFTQSLEILSTRYLTALQYLKLANNRLMQIINQTEDPADTYTRGLTERIETFIKDQK